jgi:hypothetical protein
VLIGFSGSALFALIGVQQNGSTRVIYNIPILMVENQVISAILP